MCSFDGRSGTSTGAIPEERYEQALRDHLYIVRRAQWKIDQRLSLRENERAWKGIESRQTILLARRTRTIKLCSSDASSEGQSGDSLLRRNKQASFEGLSVSLDAHSWAITKVRRKSRARKQDM